MADEFQTTEFYADGAGAMTLSTHAALTALPVRKPQRAARKGSAPARFALELAAGQTPAQITAALSSLGDLGPVVAPISPLDQGVQILTLNTRTLDGAEPAAAFAAGYALADEFRLASAEPDLPTAFYPETELPVEFDLPVPEALDFPPGCWAPSENQLSATWALDAMRVPQAWQFSADQGRPARGAGVVIAQPDTGITKHAELLDVPTSGGWDVIDNDDDPTDKRTLADRLGLGNPGHGTGTASVVVSRPAHIVTGSAPAATHMPIRAVESVVRIQQVSVAQAINRAVDHGAHVITMSLGGVPAEVLHRAIRRAVAADVIVLAAAGNCVRTVVWPARYDEVIAVAGTNADDAMWRGTCRGAAVDISAPGQNVRKASVPGSGPIGDAVGQGQGTSFAVALTAGVAALWLAHRGRPDLVAAARARGETLQQMFRRLVQASARKTRELELIRAGLPCHPMPRWLVTLLAVQGVALAAAGAVLYAGGAMSHMMMEMQRPGWPWPVTPLTSQVIGAWLLSFAIAIAVAVRDRDLSRMFVPSVAYAAFGGLELMIMLANRSAAGTDIRWLWVDAAVLATLIPTGVYGATAALARR